VRSRGLREGSKVRDVGHAYDISSQRQKGVQKERTLSDQQVDARIMLVVNAFKQSIQTSATPGLSVNSHPNPFFLNVLGSIDLRAAAEAALKRIDQFVADEKERAAKAADAKVVAE
jgi:hypothetical protein